MQTLLYVFFQYSAEEHKNNNCLLQIKLQHIFNVSNCLSLIGVLNVASSV